MIKVHDQSIYTASHDCFLLKCPVDDLSNITMVTRMECPINCFDIVDGTLFVASDNPHVSVHDLQSVLHSSILSFHAKKVVGIKADPTGSWLATVSLDNVCAIWSIDSAKREHSVPFDSSVVSTGKVNSIGIDWNQHSVCAIPCGNLVLLVSAISGSVVSSISLKSVCSSQAVECLFCGDLLLVRCIGNVLVVVCTKSGRIVWSRTDSGCAGWIDGKVYSIGQNLEFAVESVEGAVE